MLKLAILVLLPAGVDADTASQLVGRWQSEPIKAESGKTMAVEFRVLKDKPTAEDVQSLLISHATILLVDQVEPAKGYMVAHLIESVRDLGPGGAKRTLV